MAFVVTIGRGASGNALTRVIGARVEFGSDVSTGCVDSTAKPSGTSVPRVRWGSCVLVVAVGGGNDDVVLVSPLALVGGGGRVDLGAPQSALVVVGAGRVGASVAGVNAGITLNVDVESIAR